MANPLKPKQRTFVVGLIMIGLGIIVFFGLRTVRAFREFHSHRPPPLFATKPVETDAELIRDWMTLPYISIMYHLPLNLLYETLNIPPEGNEKKSLKQINDQYYPQAPGIVIEMVKSAILASQPDTVVPALTPIPPALP